MAEELKIHFFDVGEGDAALLSFDDRHYLIDTGNAKSIYSLAGKLDKITDQLAGIIITHLHQDHLGGFFYLYEKFNRPFVFDNGAAIPGIEEPYRWYAELARKTNPRNYRALTRGDKINLGAINLEVLVPTLERFPGDDWNENSLVIRLQYGKFCALLMGDALIATEKFLLEHEASLKCDLVKLGHHGSKYTGDQDFITAVSPQYAVLSVNQDNVREYPSSEVLERWKLSGSKLLRTDLNGDIVFTVAKTGAIQQQSASGK
ncbi:MBL fold metallo-hydrolase [bacterium]|nr:MBL fold metallo-hydrolase [bacterium]